MDTQKIVKALIDSQALVRVPTDMLEVTGADVLAGQSHVVGLLCPKRVQDRHDEIVITYGERDTFGRLYQFSVTCGDVRAGEDAVLAKVEAQLAAQMPAGGATTQDTGGGTKPTTPK